MKRTLGSENERKDKLFEAWNRHTNHIDDLFNVDDIEEVFEGMATVLQIAKNN